MLLVEELELWHGWIHAVKGASLEVPQGKIVSLIGANASGKSSLLCGIMGIYRSAGGKVFLNKEEIQSFPVEKRVRLGISLVPEGRQIFNSFTVEENLSLGAYHRWSRNSKEMIKKEINEVFEFFPEIATRRNDLAGKLSGGMQQMLAIGRGLMSKPQVLLLDEPSLGLAPLIVKEIFKKLLILKSQGTTILLVEQNANMALNIADWVYVMDKGRIVLNDAPEKIKSDVRMRQAYLGN